MLIFPGDGTSTGGGPPRGAGPLARSRAAWASPDRQDDARATGRRTHAGVDLPGPRATSRYPAPRRSRCVPSQQPRQAGRTRRSPPDTTTVRGPARCHRRGPPAGSSKWPVPAIGIGFATPHRSRFREPRRTPRLRRSGADRSDRSRSKWSSPEPSVVERASPTACCPATRTASPGGKTSCARIWSARSRCSHLAFRPRPYVDSGRCSLISLAGYSMRRRLPAAWIYQALR